MHPVQWFFTVAAVSILLPIGTLAPPAGADVFRCQKAVAKELAKLKKTHLKALEKCLDLDNESVISGPCPDSIAALKIQRARDKAVAKIPLTCAAADLAALGFHAADCSYGPVSPGAEATCAAMSVSGHDPGQVASCLACWKAAGLNGFMTILYASHAEEVCGGTIDATSADCADFDCIAPLPDQRDLEDGSVRTCQKAIGKAGIKYFLQREKVLEKCMLAGGTKDDCENGTADPQVPLRLAKAEMKLDAMIEAKCNDFSPAATPPFCCQCGSGNACMVFATRDDCAAEPGCTVKDTKTCNTDTLVCDSISGPVKKITWWEVCPEEDACGTPLVTRGDLEECIESSADEIVDGLVCMQFPGGCP